VQHDHRPLLSCKSLQKSFAAGSESRRYVHLRQYYIIRETQITTINMDMMVAEEARASTHGYEDDNEQVVNGHEERETISDPDNKFQRAIAAWRGMYKPDVHSKILMYLQALI
jgi:hypothetical protein